MSSDVASFLEGCEEEAEPSDAETLSSTKSYQTLDSDYEDTCDSQEDVSITLGDTSDEGNSQDDSDQDGKYFQSYEYCFLICRIQVPHFSRFLEH